MKFLDAVKVNPKIQLVKGELYPFVEMEEVSTERSISSFTCKEYSSGVKFEKGDTIVARITPCLQNGKGFYCQNIEQGFGSTEFLVFRPLKVNVDNLFLYYFMRTDYVRQKMIKSMKGADGRQRVNNAVFNDLVFANYGLNKQKRIADILSAYDDLIENNQKQIKLLEEAAQRLYKEWFVDLHFPGYESTPIIDGIPQGWKKEKVGNLLGNVSRTKQIKATEYLAEGRIPIVDQSRDFIAGYTNDNDSLVDVGVPVIVFGDHTRILKYIHFPFAKGADGTQLIVSKENCMPQSLFYLSLVAVDLSNYHYARHYKYLKAEQIIVPNIDNATKFDKIASTIFLKIQNLRDTNNKLSQARDRLLPKLMSGELEV